MKIWRLSMVEMPILNMPSNASLRPHTDPLPSCLGCVCVWVGVGEDGRLGLVCMHAMYTHSGNTHQW